MEATLLESAIEKLQKADNEGCNADLTTNEATEVVKLIESLSRKVRRLEIEAAMKVVQ